MESRLPKPSALKRPQMPVKTILPTDRIRAGGTAGFGGATGGSTFSVNQTYCGNLLPPLSRDLSNLPQVLERRAGAGARAASPEPVKMGNRAKLRRSRSACDINELRGNKRTAAAPSLPSIPSKVSRLGSTLTAPGQKPGRPGVSATATASTAAKRPAVTRPAPRAAAPAATKKPTGGGASATAGGASAAPAKRIAPYDFKARFHDLLEKHKALKTKYEKQTEDMGELESMPTQLEEAQNKLYETENSLKNTLTDNECLQRQVKQHTKNIETITSSLGRTKEELSELQAIHEKVKTEHAALSKEVVHLRQRTEELLRSNEQQAAELETCKEQLFQSNMERKELHNTVMDLRGNIRVFCRIRPPLESEENRMCCTWTYHDEATVELQSIDAQAKSKMGQQIFSFDQVFHPLSSQSDIFEMVSPLIQSALDGYNICIFAYGQTGSGKTYTMDGVADNVGVIPRTVDLLFDSIRGYRNLGWEYEIKATFLEIYNEVLYDLLSNEQKDMEIRMAKNNKNDIYVSNITEETVLDPNHLRHLMHTAKMNRATASTAGNERSSRSHAVTKLELIGRHAEKQEISVGSINLVDLAGSESPKTSTRMTETKNINRSLSELTNVILALLQKQDYIPYRNSKLTHLLMPSLGGNSKTLMFINVSPFQDCFQESVKSLRFAASVNSCKMTKAKRNRYLNSSVANNSTQSNSSSSFDK
ncbi:protein claret segregational [Drosophila biarmipes]|uniref:protein claret segregational n=1 Tax=Drosophila biarmipes TaxID=125945 RepID=UPI0007E89A51|nr:protein claret segregational [Drosophila biarmipes]